MARYNSLLFLLLILLQIVVALGLNFFWKSSAEENLDEQKTLLETKVEELKTESLTSKENFDEQKTLLETKVEELKMESLTSKENFDKQKTLLETKVEELKTESLTCKENFDEQKTLLETKVEELKTESLTCKKNFDEQKTFLETKVEELKTESLTCKQNFDKQKTLLETKVEELRTESLTCKQNLMKANSENSEITEKLNAALALAPKSGERVVSETEWKKKEDGVITEKNRFSERQDKDAFVLVAIIVAGFVVVLYERSIREDLAAKRVECQEKEKALEKMEAELIASRHDYRVLEKRAMSEFLWNRVEYRPAINNNNNDKDAVVSSQTEFGDAGAAEAVDADGKRLRRPKGKLSEIYPPIEEKGVGN